MTTPSPQQRIAAGYTENNEGMKRQDERLGSSFVYNERYEEYAALLDSDRERFDKLPRQVRLGVAHYCEARDAARRTGQA